MDTSEINALNDKFKHGILCSFYFAGRPPSDDEMDDYVSEAWVRWLSTEDPMEKQSPRLCAKRSAAAQMRRWGRRADNEVWSELREDSDPLHREMREPMPVEMRNALLVEFQTQRRKGGERGLWAAARDVAILNLLWQGYNDKEIGAQLDMPHYSLRTYRRQIKERLRHMLESKRTNHLNSYCPAWAAGNFQPKEIFQ